MGFKVEECGVTETGQCALHGVEMERREATSGAVKEMKEHISELLTFKNRVLGLSILGAVVLLGSYAYTRDHTLISERRYELLEIKFNDAATDRDSLRAEVSRLRADYARTDERYLAVTTQLGLMNGRLSQLIDIMISNKPSK